MKLVKRIIEIEDQKTQLESRMHINESQRSCLKQLKKELIQLDNKKQQLEQLIRK